MWTYNGRVFTQDMAEDYFGFVYLITNTKTGMKYIGKKFLTKAGYKQVREREEKFVRYLIGRIIMVLQNTCMRILKSLALIILCEKYFTSVNRGPSVHIWS